VRVQGQEGLWVWASVSSATHGVLQCVAVCVAVNVAVCVAACVAVYVAVSVAVRSGSGAAVACGW